MKMRLFKSGLTIACLLLCLQACTPASTQKPIQVVAAQPVVVTKVQYQPLPANLLPVIDSAVGFTSVWVNGSMYAALAHDSQWLTTCKAAMDGMRSIVAKPPAAPQLATQAPSQ